MSTEPASQQ
jgi:hypothetical protein